MRTRTHRNARMPPRKANDGEFKAPPPPPQLADTWFSVALAEALSDSPLVVEVQVIPKVNTTDEVSRATASVAGWVSLVAFVPAQLSPAPPPVAVQLVALEDFHVSVVDCHAVMVVVTAGQVQTTRTTLEATAGVPAAEHCIQ
jgi:hypothetical protein